MIQTRPVILCGGSGTRLWPLSRSGFPKQFLCLTGEESLFQQAARRLVGLAGEDVDVASPFIVTNEEHRFLGLEQMREIGLNTASVLLEPVGRNTAPALTLAALAARQGDQDPILVVTPADQTVADTAAFSSAIHTAIRQAAEGTIVILGVPPTGPETGCGYIKAAAAVLPEPTFAVERFVEKPDAATAARYLAEGGYYWNAGMFVLKASVWLEALAQFRPDILHATREAWERRSIDAAFIRPGKAEFSAVPAESIDYAVMEPLSATRHTIKMVPLDAGWNDLGAWDAVWNALPKDPAGNAHMGDMLAIDSRNTLAYASSLHRKIHRPWGWYDGIDEGERFRVKRIQVKPKASLSLQKHLHRAEHWVVVKGTAEITCGDKTILLTENQSTYIPLGEVHRLANPGAIIVSAAYRAFQEGGQA